MYKTELGLHKSADHYRAYVDNCEMCYVYVILIVVVCFLAVVIINGTSSITVGLIIYILLLFFFSWFKNVIITYCFKPL